MNKNMKNIRFTICRTSSPLLKSFCKGFNGFLVFLLSFGCSDYLDVVPDNVPTVEHAFIDRASTEKYLATCYTYLPYLSNPNGDPAILGSDEWYAIEDPFYNGSMGQYYGLKMRRGEQNTNGPLFNFWDGLNNGRAMYRAIRDCNVFLENIYSVGADLPDDEAIRWAAEVKFLKAYYHFYLLRMYGAIPLQKESLPVSTSIDDVRIYRDPFDECVDYIVSLLDEAVQDLPLQILNRSSELGRITQPIALTLKADLLVMAASPLFNGNQDFINLVDDRDIHLFPTNTEPDIKKWERAAVACKNAIDTALLAGHDFYNFTKYTNISDSTKRLMTLRHVVTDQWNNEIIWSEGRFTMNDYQRYSTPLFFAAQIQWSPTDPCMFPALRMAELFYTERGVPIEEDSRFDYADRFTPVIAPADQKYYVKPGYETARLNIDRETRFYANLAFDGAIWFGNGRYKDVGDGAESEQSWVFQMKKGQENGKNANLRYSMSGYWARRTSHFESVSLTSSSNVIVRSTFPVYRLADLYLLYAEALNETLTVPNEEVYRYINLVRERAGLNGVMESWAEASRYPDKPKTKEGMREIIQQERMIELAFEGKRYWDIRRWKTAYKWLNEPIRGLNVDGATALEYNRVITYEVPQFTNKEYLAPIRQYNLRVNKNLVQNPGW
jgi:hypothetical protein